MFDWKTFAWTIGLACAAAIVLQLIGLWLGFPGDWLGTIAVGRIREPAGLGFAYYLIFLAAITIFWMGPRRTKS